MRCICAACVFLGGKARKKLRGQVVAFKDLFTLKLVFKYSTATKNVNLYFLPWNSREELKFHTQLASAFSLHM